MPNLLAVLVSAIVGFGIGALWYSPLLFGKTWLKLMKMDVTVDAAKKKEMIKSYAIGFVSTLVMVYVLGYLFDITNPSDLISGVVLSGMVWLGFIATLALGSVLWEKKPLQLYFINVLHSLVVLVVAGVILSLWG
jgi:hypothetical protein